MAKDEKKKVDGQVPAPTKPGEKKEEVKAETVQVDKKLLEQIIANQKNLEETNASQAKTITKLLEVADKGRLAIYESQNQGAELIKKVNLNVWNSAVVLGWQMITDEVGVVEGRLVEKQVIRLWLDAGIGKEPTFVDVNYLDFGRRIGKVAGEVTRISEGGGSKSYTVKLENGRVYEVDIRFVN